MQDESEYRNERVDTAPPEPPSLCTYGRAAEDALDELVLEGTQRNPGFPKLLEQAIRDRENLNL